MRKVYCRQCQESAGENVCKHPLNKKDSETYYSDKKVTRFTQSEQNIINQCPIYRKRGWFSQLWYDITQCELGD